MTPAASDSPADAAVFIILFSRMLYFLNSLRSPIEMTAAGIVAEIVIPANKPKYIFAAPSIIESSAPIMTALTVISASEFFSGSILLFASNAA